MEVKPYVGPVCGGCIHFKEYRHVGTSTRAGRCLADSPVAYRNKHTGVSRTAAGRMAAGCPYYTPLNVVIGGACEEC